MRTELHIKDKKGVFTAYTDEEMAAGTMQFNLRGDKVMEITHTIVDPAFGGQGVGKTLVKAGVAYAEEHGYEIVPICSFARAYIERRAPSDSPMKGEGFA